VILYIEIFKTDVVKTDVVVFIDNVILCLASQWPIGICYLDVNWLIPKISACGARIWSNVSFNNVSFEDLDIQYH
jgi:hypothetical protein